MEAILRNVKRLLLNFVRVNIYWLINENLYALVLTLEYFWFCLFFPLIWAYKNLGISGLIRGQAHVYGEDASFLTTRELF